MPLQKEENGKIMSTLPSSQNEFLQSGLGPGQEYEFSINMIKNNTRGPQTSKKVTTSEFWAVSKQNLEWNLITERSSYKAGLYAVEKKTSWTEKRGSGIAHMVTENTFQKQNALHCLRPINTPAVEGCTVRWAVCGWK